MAALPGGPADGGGGGQRHQVRGPAGAARREAEAAGGRGEERQAAEGAGGHAEPRQVGRRRGSRLRVWRAPIPRLAAASLPEHEPSPSRDVALLCLSVQNLSSVLSSRDRCCHPTRPGAAGAGPGHCRSLARGREKALHSHMCRSSSKLASCVRIKSRSGSRTLLKSRCLLVQGTTRLPPATETPSVGPSRAAGKAGPPPRGLATRGRTHSS